MRVAFLRLTLVTLYINLSLATVNLIAYSTEPHFACDGAPGLCAVPLSFSRAALEDMTSYLADAPGGRLPASEISSRFSSVGNGARKVDTIAVVVGGMRKGGYVGGQLEDVARAVGGVRDGTWVGSGFIGVGDVDLNGKDQLVDVMGVAGLQRWVRDGKRGVVKIEVEDKRQEEEVLTALGELRGREGGVGVIWVGGKEEVKGQGDEILADLSVKQTKKTSNETKAGDVKAGEEDRNQTSKEAKSKEEERGKGKEMSKNTSEMRPPEISAAGLTSLLVVGLLLCIFIPGFLCLWNIQTPQSFDTVDPRDVIKKMQ